MDLLQLLLKGELYGRCLRCNGKVMAALLAELELGQIWRVTFWASRFQVGATFHTEHGIVRVFGLAFGAFHSIALRNIES